jgi:outer membrane lipoprotein-sorting protein
MNKILLLLPVFAIILASGCTSDEDSIISTIKATYGQIEDYHCTGYIACFGAECNQADFFPAEWYVKKPDKMRIEKDISSIPDNTDTGITIFNGNERYRFYNSRNMERGDYVAASVDVYDPSEIVLSDLISTSGIIEMVRHLFDMMDENQMEVKTETYQYPPYIEPKEAITIYSKMQPNVPVMALDPDTFLPIFVGGMFATNCELNPSLSNNLFDLETNTDVITMVTNFMEDCNSNSDCEDGDNDTNDQCMIQAGGNYCVHNFQ